MNTHMNSDLDIVDPVKEKLLMKYHPTEILEEEETQSEQPSINMPTILCSKLNITQSYQEMLWKNEIQKKI